jgi:hypothetical protein
MRSFIKIFRDEIGSGRMMDKAIRIKGKNHLAY